MIGVLVTEEVTKEEEFGLSSFGSRCEVCILLVESRIHLQNRRCSFCCSSSQ